jgi:hypothetical protein
MDADAMSHGGIYQASAHEEGDQSLTWIRESAERYPSKVEVDGHTSATAGESLLARGTRRL